MDRLVVLSWGFLLVCLVGCTPTKPVESPSNLDPFPVPYWPTKQASALGLAAETWSPGWTELCVYSEGDLTEPQRRWVSQLSPAGGEGKVALGFEGDFDGDGQTERVVYGAWAQGTTSSGNFVAVLRGSPVHIVFLQHWEAQPTVTVFTLKPDGTLWFGGGINAGEVTMKLDWLGGQPVFTTLTGD